MKKELIKKQVALVLTLALFALLVSPASAYYEPGETLNPDCAPEDSGCDVSPTTGVDSGGTGVTSYTAGDLLYASGPATLTTLGIGVNGRVLTVSNGALAWGSGEGLGDLLSANNLSDLANAATARTNLVLGNVENTALSTWTGTSNITTVGTIGTGVWQGTAIGDTYIASGLDWNTAYGWGDHAGAGYLTTIGGQDLDALQNVLAMAEADDDILFYNATGWDSLAHGTDGQMLQYTAASGLGWVNPGSADFADGGEAGGADRTLGNTDAYDLGFLTGGSERLHISSNGNVGINQTGPSYSLDIMRSSGQVLRALADSGNSEFEVYAYSGDAFLKLSNDNDESVIKFGSEEADDQGWAMIGRDSEENYRMDIASGVDVGQNDHGKGTTRLTILQDGSVGIGTNAPSSMLEVYGGNIVVTPATAWENALTIQEGSGANAAFSLQVNGSGAGANHAFNIKRNNTNVVQIRGNGDSYFNGGDVGIGTTSPGAPLHVVTNSAVNPNMIIEQTVAGSVQLSLINTAKTWRIESDDSPAVFRIRDVTAGFDRLTIDNSGNIGIGTTSPDYALQVNGSIAPETSAQDLGTSALRWDLYSASADVNDMTINDVLVAPKKAVAPGSPVSGQIYYNTGDNKLKVYNGTIWEDLN